MFRVDVLGGQRQQQVQANRGLVGKGFGDIKARLEVTFVDPPVAADVLYARSLAG